MFKKVLILSLAFCGCLSAYAQDSSKSILETMTSKMISSDPYKVEFTAKMGDMFGDIDGMVVVSGEKYFIDANDYEIYFDGKQRYTYNCDAEEVVIEKADQNNVDFLANPSRFFRFYDSDFNHSFKERVQRSGRATDVVELRPKSGSGRIITLYVDASSKLPVSIIYRDGTGSQNTEIMIDRFIPKVQVEASKFTFDIKKNPDVEVIDFR